MSHVLEYFLKHGGHHAEGDSVGNMGNNMPKYPTFRRGGHPHHKRSKHAEGDRVEFNPVTREKANPSLSQPRNLRRGGRSCHAEGDIVTESKENAMSRKHGGSTHRKHRHHFKGDSVPFAEEERLNGKMSHGGHAHHKKKR